MTDIPSVKAGLSFVLVLINI